MRRKLTEREDHDLFKSQPRSVFTDHYRLWQKCSGIVFEFPTEFDFDHDYHPINPLEYHIDDELIQHMGIDFRGTVEFAFGNITEFIDFHDAKKVPVFCSANPSVAKHLLLRISYSAMICRMDRPAEKKVEGLGAPYFKNGDYYDYMIVEVDKIKALNGCGEEFITAFRKEHADRLQQKIDAGVVKEMNDLRCRLTDIVNRLTDYKLRLPECCVYNMFVYDDVDKFTLDDREFPITAEYVDWAERRLEDHLAWLGRCKYASDLREGYEPKIEELRKDYAFDIEYGDLGFKLRIPGMIKHLRIPYSEDGIKMLNSYCDSIKCK